MTYVKGDEFRNLVGDTIFRTVELYELLKKESRNHRVVWKRRFDHYRQIHDHSTRQDANDGAAPRRRCASDRCAPASEAAADCYDLNAGNMDPIVAFVAVAYGLSIALSLVVGLSGGYAGPLIGLRWLSMFLPGIAVFVVDWAMNEKPVIRAGLPLRYLPVAVFIIPVVLHAVMLPTMRGTEGLQWQDWLTPQDDGLYHTPASRGWGILTVEGLAARLALNVAVGPVIASFLAFFEEVGWRAWLLPRLHARMSARRAVLLTAVIWAVWHVPFQLSGVQHIDGVPPLRLAFGFPFGILVLGWLWLRTESVWLCAIAHGSLNSLGQYAFKFMKDAPATDADLLALTAGFAALLIVGSLLLWRAPPSPALRVSEPSAG